MTKKPAEQKPKRHNDEFKAETLKLAERVGVAEAAKKLGLHASQIYSWRTANKYNSTTGEREALLASENVRLKRQLAEQAEELEILKKAATYFAKNQK